MLFDESNEISVVVEGVGEGRGLPDRARSEQGRERKAPAGREVGSRRLYPWGRGSETPFLDRLDTVRPPNHGLDPLGGVVVTRSNLFLARFPTAETTQRRRSYD